MILHLCKFCRPDYLGGIFQCVVSFCKEKKQCPHPGCSISITKDSPTIRWFQAILEEMFREYETNYTPPAPKGSGKEVLNVTVLNGDATIIPYASTMTVLDVKHQIDYKLKIPQNKQKLLFKEKEVQVQILCYFFYLKCMQSLRK